MSAAQVLRALRQVPPAHRPHAVALLLQIRPAAARLAMLSGREMEVLREMAQGHSNKVIGWKLGISPRTVEIHRANAMYNLDARSLAEVVRIYVLAGMP